MDSGGRFWNGPPVNHVSPGAKASFWLVALLVLAALVRCWNFADVFVAGKVFYVDADCYSRMTRVQRVLAHPGTPVHRHEFENWPEGTQPHTTAPFDDATAALAVALRPFTVDIARATDLAGALISLLLGVAAAAFLWAWAGRLGLPYCRVPTVFLFATSPILVHGTVLGRPDHQSLLILCMAVALGAEAVLFTRSTRAWGIAAGLGWGLGLWVSLYEPGVLLGLALLLNLGNPKRLVARERWAGWAVFAAILLLAGMVDGWRSPVPDPEVIRFFSNWSRAIGELNHLPPWSPVLMRWTLGLLPLSPVLLLLAGLRKKDADRRALFWLAMLLAMVALTCWQVRWGYFLALVFAMSLPWQLSVFPKRWVALAVFAVAFLPVAGEWMSRAGRAERSRRAEQRADNLALYAVAQQLRGPLRLPILAPWWQSPALAYWSGQPCVAGSSHESLPGTVDSARFYASTDPREALAILARRKVACVIAYDPGRVLAVSDAILGLPQDKETANASRNTMAEWLYTRPHSPPPGLELAGMNPAFRVFLRPEGVETHE